MGEFWSGLVGSFVGAAAALAGVWLGHHLQTRRESRRDEGRKAMLRHMLDNKPPDTEWRYLTTMARVIGASKDETAKLLIDIGARGSKTESDGWAYVKEKPLD